MVSMSALKLALNAYKVYWCVLKAWAQECMPPLVPFCYTTVCKILCSISN